MKPFRLSASLLLCAALSACSSVETQNSTAEAGRPVAAVQSPAAKQTAALAQAVKVDPEWLNYYEPRLREALKGSHFEVHRHNDLLMVSAPADYSFNPDRPTMLVPAALGPITQIAKLVEQDKKTAVMVLGHSDAPGADSLTQDRARSFGSIFRLSGLHPDRLQMKGMGSSMPRNTSNTKDGRAQNRRVEMVLTPKQNLGVLLAQYESAFPGMLASASNPAPAVAPKVAAVSGKPAAKKAVAKKATSKKPTQLASAANTKKK